MIRSLILYVHYGGSIGGSSLLWAWQQVSKGYVVDGGPSGGTLIYLANLVYVSVLRGYDPALVCRGADIKHTDLLDRVP